MKLYCIYDKVAKKFNAPFVAENDDVANRSFQKGVDSPFAEDFDLYCVGSFNMSADCIECPICPENHFVSHFTGGVVVEP